MASNLDTLVTVFGGSGFLGRSVVRALAKREYRIRVAVRRPELAVPFAAARPGRPDPRRAGQSALPGLRRGRDARLPRRHQSGRHPGRERRADLRRGAGRRRRRSGEGGRRRRRRHGACLRHRRRRKFALALRPRQGRGREGGAGGGPVGDYPAPFGRVRPRGPVHQPLRGAGADVAGAAADRRRPDKTAAGVCRRRRDRGCRRRGWQDQARRDLRTRRPGSADHARDHGNYPDDHRTRAHAGLAAVWPREDAGTVAAVRAGTIQTDAGPGGAAAQRQCGVGRRQSRRPHPGRVGNRAGFAGSDRPAISLALPLPRAVSAQERVRFIGRETD